MRVTGSINIKALGGRQSYRGLRNNHFLIDRKGKGISKRGELTKLNKHIPLRIIERVDANLDALVEERLMAYNARPAQKRNKSRQIKDQSALVDKKQANKNANPDFNGLEYLMVAKVGDMESWEQVLELFRSHGVSEEETLDCLNDSFKHYFVWFNRTYYGHDTDSGLYGDDPGICILEMDTNLDEKGAPHAHYRVRLTGTASNGLPETNFAAALKGKYGDKITTKKLLSRFREDCDTALIDKASEQLISLAKSKGFEFEGLQLTRKKAERTGLDHDRYVADMQEQARIEEREKSLSEREKALDEREESLNERSKALDEKEEGLVSRFRRLDERELDIAPKEQELERRSEALTSISEALDKRQGEIDDRDARSRQIASQLEEGLNNAKETLTANVASAYDIMADMKKFNDLPQAQFNKFKQHFDKRVQIRKEFIEKQRRKELYHSIGFSPSSPSNDYDDNFEF